MVFPSQVPQVPHLCWYLFAGHLCSPLGGCRWLTVGIQLCQYLHLPTGFRMVSTSNHCFRAQVLSRFVFNLKGNFEEDCDSVLDCTGAMIKIYPFLRFPIDGRKCYKSLSYTHHPGKVLIGFLSF